MQTIQFYQKIPDMECLQGDTLSPFCITPENISDLSGYSMCLILEKDGGIVIQKSCTQEDGAFYVQLTSADTAALSGIYQIHFRMTDTRGLFYRKITGTFKVNPIAQGG